MRLLGATMENPLEAVLGGLAYKQARPYSGSLTPLLAMVLGVIVGYLVQRRSMTFFSQTSTKHRKKNGRGRSLISERTPLQRIWLQRTK